MSLFGKTESRCFTQQTPGSAGSIPQSAQCVMVSAVGSAATIMCLEMTKRCGWVIVGGLHDLRGFLGRNGVSSNKRELDGYTPAGLYRLGCTFGLNSKPETKMPWRPVTPDSWWVDDPTSVWYNQWVEAPYKDGWTSAEHLIDFPEEYAYAVVVQYNTDDIIPGKGSAIFLHCGTHPTAGCIAMRAEDLLRILKWLDPEKHPDILIQSMEMRDSSDSRWS